VAHEVYGKRGALDLPIKPIIAHSSFVNLHTYINQGWETGF